MVKLADKLLYSLDHDNMDQLNNVIMAVYQIAWLLPCWRYDVAVNSQ